MSNTGADLYNYVKFITGQDNLSTAQANMLFKSAVADYSSIALTADGRWKFDDLNHTNAVGLSTYPIASATVTSLNSKVPLDATFLMIDRVTITVNGTEFPLKAIDRREHKQESLVSFYGSSGRPTHYDYDAHAVEVFPHADGTYPVTVYYSRSAVEIDAANNVTDIGIPVVHHYYYALHAARQLGFRTIDGNRTDIAQELVKWEGEMVNGRQVGGKIREWYAKRDEDTPRRIKPKHLSLKTFGNRK